MSERLQQAILAARYQLIQCASSGLLPEAGIKACLEVDKMLEDGLLDVESGARGFACSVCGVRMVDHIGKKIPHDWVCKSPAIALLVAESARAYQAGEYKYSSSLDVAIRFLEAR